MTRPEGRVLSGDADEALERLAHRPVAVTVDMHRGHLDPEVATLPLPRDRCGPLVARCVAHLDDVRSLGVPVVHVVTAYRNQEEILANPYWRFQAGRRDSRRARIADHNLEGTPGLELMPGVGRDGDLIVKTKKRYDCFIGTDLEITLDALGCDSLLLTGVNTNSCVIATGIAASVRDYAVFLVEDGIDSMLGDELHVAALRVIDASFGWVTDAQSLSAALRARGGAAPQSAGT